MTQSGAVLSLAWPGQGAIELTPKLIELAADLAPRASGIALLVNSQSDLFMEAITRLADQAAHYKQVPLHVEKATSVHEIEDAFNSLSQLRPGALVVGINPFFATQRTKSRNSIESNNVTGYPSRPHLHSGARSPVTNLAGRASLPRSSGHFGR